MQNYAKIQTLFRTGRYECDGFFYKELKSILQFLNLYELIPPIEHNLEIVEQIEKLTNQHLQQLENQDDEESALQTIHKINESVKKINTEETGKIMKQVQKLEGKGYIQRVIELIKRSSFKKSYLEVGERLMKTVYNPQIRVNDILLMGLFFSKNGEKLNNFIQIFGNILENGVNDLKQFRQNYQYIQSHSQTLQHPKVQNYLKGSSLILNKLLRVNEIYKVLTGDSKYGLKLNSLKKPIEDANHNTSTAKKINLDMFKEYLQNGGELPSICSICLQPSDKDHQNCLGVIKVLFKQNPN